MQKLIYLTIVGVCEEENLIHVVLVTNNFFTSDILFIYVTDVSVAMESNSSIG